MAAFISIGERFNNRDKRFAESVVMTVPALYEEGSPRTGLGDKYITSGDSMTAQIIEPGTILKKLYLIVDEAFPVGTELSVDIAGTTYLSAVDGAATGLTVSTTEDVLLNNKQTISVLVVNGPEGTEITTGVARVVVDSVSTNLKNGNYAG